MCLPAAGAFTVAQTGIGILGAASQHRREQGLAADAAQQANRSAVIQYQQLQNRQIQEAAVAAQAISANAAKARSAEGALRTSIGESGIGGNTAAELTAGFERTASNYEGAVIRNKAMLDANFKDQATAIQEGAHADAARAFAQVQPPNYLGILMKGIGSYLNLGNDTPVKSAAGAGSAPAAEASFGDVPSYNPTTYRISPTIYGDEN